MNSKNIIVSLSVLCLFSLATNSSGGNKLSKPIVIHSDKNSQQQPQGEKLKKQSSHLVKYHSQYNGITLFYDEEKRFSNFIALTDKQLGKTYGVINNNQTTLYDQNLNSLGIYVYLLRDKSGNEKLKVDGNRKKYSRTLLNNLETRLSEKSISIFSLLLSPTNVAQGVSINAGVVSYDTATDSDQNKIKGQRIHLGDIVLANWWTDKGEIKGFEHKRGKISFYTFTMENGEVISGSTLELPGLNLKY